MIHELLVHLARKGALFGFFSTSTRQLAKELGSSQQTVSRILITLEDNKLIERQASPRGVRIRLTAAAQQRLYKEFEVLKHIFAPPEVLKGKVSSGLGEGAYYIRVYAKKIEKKAGFRPYAGTLNLLVEREKINRFVMGIPQKLVEAFNTRARTFGAVALCEVRIDAVRAAIVIPERARHAQSTLEIIAPVNLRVMLKLNDGDSVEIRRVEDEKK